MFVLSILIKTHRFTYPTIGFEGTGKRSVSESIRFNLQMSPLDTILRGENTKYIKEFFQYFCILVFKSHRRIFHFLRVCIIRFHHDVFDFTYFSVLVYKKCVEIMHISMTRNDVKIARNNSIIQIFRNMSLYK